MMSLFNCSMKI